MENKKTSWIIPSVSILGAIAILLYAYICSNNVFFYLTIGGILAGIVNFFYVYLNIPIVRKADSTNPNTLLADENEWQLPSRSWKLALLGYLILGIAGAYLTILINALIGLKGAPSSGTEESWNYWILLGYSLIFGFGVNRLLSSILGNIISRINTLENKPPVSSGSATPPNPPQTLIAERLTNIIPHLVPNSFDDLINIPPDLQVSYLKGIDISHHNGQISDWQSIKNLGVSIVYIKISEGVGTPDVMAQTNALIAKQNGMKVGYYHFGRPDSRNGGTVEKDANAEASEVSSILTNLPKADLPFVLDLENTSTWDSPLPPNNYLLWVDTFLTGLISLSPSINKHIIYSRKEYLDRKLPSNHGLANRCQLWLSRYNNDFNSAIPATGWNNWIMWQFSGDSAYIGLNPKPIDLNVVRPNFP